MKQKRTTYGEPKFYLEVKGDRPAPIYLLYSFGSGRLKYYTGQRIEPRKWHTEKQRVKPSVTGSLQVNAILDEINETAKRTVRECQLKRLPVTKETLRKALDSLKGIEEAGSNFFEVYDYFIQTEGRLKAWTKGTHVKLNTIRTQLQAFEAHKQTANRTYRIEFWQINEAFFEELVEFWQSKYGLRNSTIQKNIVIFRWFLNWSAKKDFCSYGFKKVTTKLKDSKHKVIFLDLSELETIKNTVLPANKEYLQRTRDIFIFQCFTGLRFSDLRNLKSTDIKSDHINVNTIKTGEVIEVELTDITRPILDKYKTHQAATGKALPVMANQVYNKFLKELAKLAGLNESITLVHYKGSERIEETFQKWQLVCTHTARRSFITNGLTLGIAGEVLRSWTGHVNDKSFSVYYEIVKNRKRQDMQKFTFKANGNES